MPEIDEKKPNEREVKLCPFCQCSNIKVPDGHFAQCNNCEARGPTYPYHSIQESLNRWNRRPSSESHPKCANCGMTMNPGESETFTVCDDCFEKHYEDKTKSSYPESPRPKDMHPDTIDWNKGGKMAVDFLNGDKVKWPERLELDGSDTDYTYGFNACHDAFMSIINSLPASNGRLVPLDRNKVIEELGKLCETGSFYTSGRAADAICAKFGQARVPSEQDILYVLYDRDAIGTKLYEKRPEEISKAIHSLIVWGKA